MSMLLKGRGGNEFELGFSRESLPDVQDGTGDSGYVHVTFRVATQDDEWEETAPAINLFEFTNLAEWLESLGGERIGEEAEIELLQPELRFTVINATTADTVDEAAARKSGRVTIRIYFHVDDRPEEFIVDAETTEAPYIDLTMNRDDVLTAAAQLRGILEELDLSNLKDDITGEQDTGLIAAGSDDDLNLIDGISDEPPGAGAGEDNAGNR